MSELEISGNYTCIDNNNEIDVKYINIKEITNNNNKNLDMSKIKNIYVENKINKNNENHINFDMKDYIYDLIDKNLEDNLFNENLDYNLIDDDIYSDENLDDDLIDEENHFNDNLIDDDIFSDENIEYILYNNNKLYIKDKEIHKIYKQEKKIFIFGIIIFSINYLSKSPKVLSLA